jgi:hypothetical protein
MKKSQNGNVIFIILIAVALFAALGFAITASTRASGNGNINKDKGDLTASRILNFTVSVQGAVTRLMTMSGEPITSLKFNNDLSTTFDGTPILSAMGTPADPSLYVFHPQGGGAIPQVFEDAVTPCSGCANQVKAGHFSVIWLNVPNAGTEASDVALQIADLDNEACLAINRRQGINFIPNTYFQGGSFRDAITPPPLPVISGNTAEDQAAIEGKSVFCMKKTNAAVRNNFIAVLKAY